AAALSDLFRQVQLLGDAQRLLVVAEVTPEARVQGVVQRLPPRVPEPRVAHVVTEPDRLDEILVQAQGARDPAGNAGRLEGVRHAGAVMVAGGIDEHLRLSLQTAKRL